MRSLASPRLILGALVASLAPTATGQSYDIFDMDGNGLLGLGAPFRMNESGSAVGIGDQFGSTYSAPVVWTNQQTTVLPLVTDHESGFANDINEAGVVVGASDDITLQGQFLFVDRNAAMWVNGNPVLLSSLVAEDTTFELHEARVINEAGRILGEGRESSIPALRAFIFENGSVTDLGALSPSGRTEPFDMNEQGHVVGSSQVTLGVHHAFVWKDGVMTDLHDPIAIPGGISTARGINEFGVIVGSADFINDGTPKETAAIWKNGVVTNLGTLAGVQSQANDINEHGTVVGLTTWSGSGVRAFIYRNGTMNDLNDLLPPGSRWTLSTAAHISNDGRIIGEGFLRGAKKPFLLVPDCDGSFSIYGSGCSGSGGFTATLWGQGCPGFDVSLALTNGPGGGQSVLAFGAGQGVLPINPLCSLQILPIIPGTVTQALGGSGDGDGTWQTVFPLPLGFPAVTLNLQSVVFDAGAPGGITLSRPLQWDIF